MPRPIRCWSICSAGQVGAVRSARVRLAPVRSAPVRSARVRLARVRSARSGWRGSGRRRSGRRRPGWRGQVGAAQVGAGQVAPVRSASVRLARTRLAPVRLAPVRSAPADIRLVQVYGTGSSRAPSDHCQGGLDVRRRPLGRRPWLGRLGALANERGQRFKHRLMVLVRTVHHAFERIDAAKPDDDVFHFLIARSPSKPDR